jgi:hypothetical protein
MEATVPTSAEVEHFVPTSKVPTASMMMSARETTWDGPAAPPLQIFEVLNMNPMVQDATDPSGYRDSVAQLALTDFHDLIVYFMDEDLRKTFVQISVPSLNPAVLAIANDDTASPGQNKAFYQKLQVPFIVSMLAAGKVHINFLS